MKIAVLGGRGFVGSAVTEQLREHGHDVTTVDPNIGGANHISLNILSKHLPERLEGFDAVVNLVGLSPMHEPRSTTYEKIHVRGARNVVASCQVNGIEKLVHMSALGADADADTEFLRTKGEAEEIVRNSGLDATILRPSMIFDTENELVRAASRFAWTRMFPNVRTRVQPIYRQDVVTVFAQAVEGAVDEGILELGGPDQMALFDFVKQIYNANGYPCHALPVVPLMKLGLYMFEYVPIIPFGTDQARYLEVDNTTGDNDAEEYADLTAYGDWLEETY